MNIDKIVKIQKWYRGNILRLKRLPQIQNHLQLCMYNKIVKIQKVFRGYIIRQNLIIKSQNQDKKWRKTQKWYIDGKRNECEIYQRCLIEKITKEKCIKTNYRINMITHEMKIERQPMKRTDGFEWTEDFDGSIKYKTNDFYFNLKFICDNGGAQTRSLREVYHFIINQIENNSKNTYFVNILDGDTSYKHMDKFNYLLNKNEYIEKNKNIFIGDMYNFQKWWRIISK